MKNILGIAAISSLLLLSCDKEPQDIVTLQLTDDLYIVSTDTVTTHYSVYRVDSFLTSGTNRAIIGAASDPYFGRISSEAYCRFKLPSGIDYQKVGASNHYYDSIALIIRTDSTYYGDTLSNWQVSAYQIQQDFESSGYYNNQKLLSSDQPLGSAAVRFRPQVDDSVLIRLDDHFGRELFERYRQNDLLIQSQDAFLRLFKGLKISGTPSDETIYRFAISDSTFLIRLYYHEDQGKSVQKHIDFSAEGGAYHFNRIECDVSSGPLQDLSPGAVLSSDQLGNRIFYNDLAGVGTRITFPSAPRLAALPNFIRLSEATLQIRPSPDNSAKFPLVPAMGMILNNESNITNQPLYDPSGSALQTGNLYIDRLYGVNTGYTYDLSEVIHAEISSTAYTTLTAELYPFTGSGVSDFSMYRLVANDNRHPVRPSSLHIQMIFYKR